MSLFTSIVTNKSKAGDVGKQGSVDRRMVATPWIARTAGGLWVGADGSVWLYRKLPTYPFAWEVADVQLSKGDRIYQMLEELGKTSKPPSVGEFASLSKNRRVHLVTHVRYIPPPIPPGSSPEQAAFLFEVLGETGVAVPDQVTAIGVELWPAISSAKRRRNRGVVAQVKDYVAQYTGGKLPELELYETDKELISQLLGRYGAEILSREERLFLERWISGPGNTDEPTFVEEDDRVVVRDRNPVAFDRWARLYELSMRCDAAGDHARAEELISEAERKIVEGGNVIQFLAVTESGMPDEIGKAPMAPWLMDAQQHEQAAICTSVRFELEPGRVTRNRARRLQRHQFRQIEEELQANSVLSRVEQEEAFSGAKAVEDHYATTAEPSITKMSILWAWQFDESATENFADFLRARYDIDANVMQKRQFDCYAETLPTSPIMAAPDRPYSHDAFIQTIAYSGIGAATHLGDSIVPSRDPHAPLPVGAMSGIAHPSGTVVWTNPWASSELNTSPTMTIVGQPGSGKTFYAQLLCYQFQLQGIPVFFVNPKGSDSLRDYAEFCGGQLIRISDATQKPGAFDPFRFGDPDVVVPIAQEHITTSLNERGNGLTMEQNIAVGEAISQGVRMAQEMVARHGGSIADYGSVGQSLHFLPPHHVQVAKNIWAFARQNPNFALGIAMEPRGEMSAKTNFTLVEFDQEAALPERTNPNELTMVENSAIAAQRILWRAGIEIMRKAGGGVVAGDEAWTFLSSPQASRIIDSLNRKGRSMQIFLMLMTQRIADVVAADLEAYLSRVGVFHLEDKREIEAALQLCRMELRPDLVELIRNAKPEPADPGDPDRGIPGKPARPSQMIFKDIYGRHGVVTVEPVLERYRLAFSTNRRDKERRQRVRDAR